MMIAGVRKFALTTHVTASVGWLGAVAAFLALALGGLTSRDAQMVRAAYLSMDFLTWFVIVPLCVASLITGLVQSLGTAWGLFRHYWVVAKLGLTVVATVILLVHTQPIGAVAQIALQGPIAAGDLRPLRMQLVADAVAALFALLAATTLSVFKPWGLTNARALGRTALVIALGLLLLFMAWHLATGGMHSH